MKNFYWLRILLLVCAVILLPQCQKNKTTESKTQTAAVVLRDGELYEISGDKIGSKITVTNRNVKSYLMTPNKRYVAYSAFVGYYNVVGLDDSGDLQPVHHIIVMDLDRKQQLTEIKPQSENEPFIYVDHWLSNDELLLQEADGFATGYNYVYRISNNELRIADSSGEEDLNSEESGT